MVTDEKPIEKDPLLPRRRPQSFMENVEKGMYESLTSPGVVMCVTPCHYASSCSSNVIIVPYHHLSSYVITRHHEKAHQQVDNFCDALTRCITERKLPHRGGCSTPCAGSTIVSTNHEDCCQGRWTQDPLLDPTRECRVTKPRQPLANSEYNQHNNLKSKISTSNCKTVTSN